MGYSARRMGRRRRRGCRLYFVRQSGSSSIPLLPRSQADSLAHTDAADGLAEATTRVRHAAIPQDGVSQPFRRVRFPGLTAPFLQTSRHPRRAVRRAHWSRIGQGLLAVHDRSRGRARPRHRALVERRRARGDARGAPVVVAGCETVDCGEGDGANDPTQSGDSARRCGGLCE